MISGWILSLLLLTGQVQQPASDIARLRELLADKKQPQLQAQAAYLILQQQTPSQLKPLNNICATPVMLKFLPPLQGLSSCEEMAAFLKN